MTTGYSIELLFNKDFDGYVRSLWQSCGQNNLSNHMLSIKGDVMPHITLSIYEGITDDDIVSLFNRYKNVAESTACFESGAICMFKDTLVTYLNVNVNRDMLNYFENVYNFFGSISAKCSPYYLPFTIIPHVSIAKCHDLESAKTCWAHVADVFEPQKFQVESIVLVKLYFGEGRVLKKCELMDEKVLE